MSRASHPGSLVPLHVRTPLVRSDALSERAGREVWLKLDALQPSGSFKLRGIGRRAAEAIALGAERLVSSSGGNAGLATAWSGRALGVRTTVVLPETTPPFVRVRLERLGAEVMVHGAQWAEANAHAEALAASTGGALVHPFEGEATWAGHATLVAEVLEDLAPLDRVPAAFVVSVGGGGLAMGVLEGLSLAGLADRCVLLAVETEGADGLARSLAAGEIVTLSSITSVAKSLGAAAPGARIFEACRALHARGLVRPWTCTDREAVRAVINFANEHRLLVEPACGAALACVDVLPSLLGDVPGPVVIEVCGGAVMDLATLERLARVFDLPLA